MHSTLHLNPWRAAYADQNTKGLQQIQVKTMNVWATAFTHQLPFQRFHVLFTLFSKCFASFPHGTCLLSVSCQYLALDEVYHPLKAALSSNPTLWESITKGRVKTATKDGALTLHGRLFQSHFGHRPTWTPTLNATIRPAAPKWTDRFQAWAVPSSLAVTKGILVSFFSSA